ncbi:reverse transcriptase domain-containing protein [Tanacetum coccineum]
MVTSMGICHAKPYTLRDEPSTKLEQRSDSQTHVLHLHQGYSRLDNSTITQRTLQSYRSMIVPIFAQSRMVEDDEEKTRFHTEEGVYCFIHMPKELKNSVATLQRMMEKILADQRGRNVEVYLEEVVIKIKEGKFLGHMVTEEGLKADPEKIQAIILSPTLRGPNQIRSLFLQLTTISKFIPKLAELKYPIREVRTRWETAKGSGWTNEAEEALRRIKRKVGKLQTLAIPKEGEVLMLCLRQRNETISYVLLVEREGIQILVSYVSRPLQGMEICYTPTKKRVQALIHTTRSLRTVFRKHKVKVIIDGPMEETLKLSEREGRLGKWATKIRTYDISYIQIKEVEGSVIRKFFVQGEQVEKIPYANEGGTLNLSKKIHAKSTPTPRAWRLYLGKEAIKEGSGVGIILVSPEEKMYSYVIRLKFKASNYAMDCEALLAGLAASANQGLATINLEFLNQEVSVGIKTRPSVVETNNIKEGKEASNAPGARPNYNQEASGSN